MNYNSKHAFIVAIFIYYYNYFLILLRRPTSNKKAMQMRITDDLSPTISTICYLSVTFNFSYYDILKFVKLFTLTFLKIPNCLLMIKWIHPYVHTVTSDFEAVYGGHISGMEKRKKK